MRTVVFSAFSSKWAPSRPPGRTQSFWLMLRCDRAAPGRWGWARCPFQPGSPGGMRGVCAGRGGADAPVAAGFAEERGCGEVSAPLRGGWVLTPPRGRHEWGFSAMKFLFHLNAGGGEGVKKKKQKKSKEASASAQLLSCITFPLERCYNSNSITVNSVHHLHSWKIL